MGSESELSPKSDTSAWEREGGGRVATHLEGLGELKCGALVKVRFPRGRGRGREQNGESAASIKSGKAQTSVGAAEEAQEGGHNRGHNFRSL